MTKKALKAKIKPLKLLILDVDGVMTDGGIIYGDDGREMKRFDVKDGHGIKLLMQGGVDVAIITARTSRAVEHRAKNLGIKLVYQGCKDKLSAFEDILANTGLLARETAFMGDDIVDLPVLGRAGFSIAVADAVAEVRKSVDYVANKPGGRGAIREAAELILKSKGVWKAALAMYLK